MTVSFRLPETAAARLQSELERISERFGIPDHQPGLALAKAAEILERMGAAGDCLADLGTVSGELSEEQG